jgi:hypothetical protein
LPAPTFTAIDVADASLAAAVVPTMGMLRGFAGFIATATALTGWGSLLVPSLGADAMLIAGWGAASILFTTWGVLTDWPMRGLGYAFLAAGLFAAVRRPAFARAARPLLRQLVLTLPLWVVLLPILPSQIDGWLNILPNAAYLTDHATFPAAGRAPSYSFLPGAPYNTQFVSFLVSLGAGAFVPTALPWFALLLQTCAALLLARVIAGKPDDATAPAGWSAMAAACLLTIPLNPGFAPRVFLSCYGEAPLAVGALFAVWHGVRAVDTHPRRWSCDWTMLALVLTAVVNTKQSGPGLVWAIMAGLAALAALSAAAGKPAFWRLAAGMLPAMLLFALWHHYQHVAGIAALAPLPVGNWNTDVLPEIAAAMWQAMVRAAALFVPLLILAGWGLELALFRRPASGGGRLVVAGAVTTVAYSAYLVATYVTHFPRAWAVQAHSFARYESHLSLLMIGTLLAGLRPALAGRWERIAPRTRRLLGQAAVALVVVMPFGAITLLRYDLDPPQPALRAIASDAATHVHDGDRVALVLPGDEADTAGSFLRGSLLFTEPRHRALVFRTEGSATPDTLERLARDGFRVALVACTGQGMADAPGGLSAVLEYGNGEWRTRRLWRYPDHFASRRGPAMLPPRPFCLPTG